MMARPSVAHHKDKPQTQLSSRTGAPTFGLSRLIALTYPARRLIATSLGGPLPALLAPCYGRPNPRALGKGKLVDMSDTALTEPNPVAESYHELQAPEDLA